MSLADAIMELIYSTGHTGMYVQFKYDSRTSGLLVIKNRTGASNPFLGSIVIRFPDTNACVYLC